MKKIYEPIRKKAFLFFLLHSLFGFGEWTVISEKEYVTRDRQERRIYKDVVLTSGTGDEAIFTISLPEKRPPQGLETILIVGGLKTGRESLQFIPDHGECALVSYEYPQSLKALHKMNILFHLYTVRKAILSIPDALIHTIQYLRKEHWINQDPISVMGYSFGATFLPVLYVKAQEEGISLGPGVMAYGGAGIDCLLRANLPLPHFLKKPVASIAAAALKPIDPLFYAPLMKGEFLIINGIYDSQVPLECAEHLQTLVPEPKTVINLETPHMSPENLDLNLQLIHISRQWLEKNDFLK